MDNKRNGCIECSRYGFIVLNVAVLLTGILLALLGTWFYAVPASENLTAIVLTPANQDLFRVILLLVISVGAGCCALAIVSCCAALSRSKCSLITIFILTGVMIIAESVVLGYGIFYSDVISSGITDRMTETLAIDYAGDHASNKESMGWTEMQSYFSCCGIDTTEGYQNHTNVQYLTVTGSLWYREHKDGTDDWPQSCCQSLNETEVAGKIACSSYKDGSPLYLSEKGCSEEAESFLMTHLYLIIGITSLLLLYECISVGLSVMLYMDFMKKQDKYLDGQGDRKAYNKFRNSPKVSDKAKRNQESEYVELDDWEFTPGTRYMNDANENHDGNASSEEQGQENQASSFNFPKVVAGAVIGKESHGKPDYPNEVQQHSTSEFSSTRVAGFDEESHQEFIDVIDAPQTFDGFNFPRVSRFNAEEESHQTFYDPTIRQDSESSSIPGVVESTNEPTSPYEF